jgi:hypothetical protein
MLAVSCSTELKRGRELTDVIQQLQTGYAAAPAVTERLRFLWGLEVVGAISNEWLIEQLEDEEEHIRTWSVKLLSDAGPLPTPSKRHSSPEPNGSPADLSRPSSPRHYSDSPPNGAGTWERPCCNTIPSATIPT